MDGETTITLEQHAATNLEKRLLQLVLDLEGDGYRICTGQLKGYWIEYPDSPIGRRPCARIRFDMALDESPELEAALLPFLQKYRPPTIWESPRG